MLSKFPLMAACAGILCASVTAGCDRKVDDRIEEVGSVEIGKLVPAFREPNFEATGRDRLALFGETKQRGPFRFATPVDWEVSTEESPMRIVDCTFGPKGEGECYVSFLQGSGGGVLENVNRWRKQMGMEPLPEGAEASMQRVRILKSSGYLFDETGTFSGMQGAEPKENFRMLGAVLPAEDMGLTIFVKMTGPAELVAAHANDFYRFCGNLEIGRTNG